MGVCRCRLTRTVGSCHNGIRASFAGAAEHSALRALRTPHSALRTPHSALSTHALRTPHSGAPHSALRTPHSALSTQHPLHSALFMLRAGFTTLFAGVPITGAGRAGLRDGFADHARSAAAHSLFNDPGTLSAPASGPRHPGVGCCATRRHLTFARTGHHRIAVIGVLILLLALLVDHAPGWFAAMALTSDLPGQSVSTALASGLVRDGIRARCGDVVVAVLMASIGCISAS